ncbi:hypothetical protein EYF80_009978 [Liparis tanakae]|uniref:Uncharacterized protein n=1 Tax=Liparis tanakae TaxID=230148 RepID=A0A4Z2IPC0_9TELE|nr:hypothetical protein EYF80_009978 [Liparis tanakae]
METPQLHLHLLYKYVAVGRLIRVQQLDQVGMVQSLKESHLLQHLLPKQQLLVNVLCCDAWHLTPLLWVECMDCSLVEEQVLMRSMSLLWEELR